MIFPKLNSAIKYHFSLSIFGVIFFSSSYSQVSSSSKRKKEQEEISAFFLSLGIHILCIKIYSNYLLQKDKL